MLRRIILENFMSHGRTEIDLADGLTVLTGPNNCGKSAVVAALQILATNGRSKHVLRHGAKFARVTVETDDGHTICWERSKTSVKYTIDGEDIHRVGSSVPDSLHDLLRLDRVVTEAGKTKHEYDIHFGEQKSPIFLLGETGSRAASFFASSSDASRLVEMQHLHRLKLRDQRTEAKRLNAKSGVNTARLNRFEPIEIISVRVAEADSVQQAIVDSENRIGRLKVLVRQLDKQILQSRHLQNLRRTLERLDLTETNPTSLHQANQKSAQLHSLANSLADNDLEITRLARVSGVLKPLLPAPPLKEVSRIQQLTDNLTSGTARRNSASATVAACSELTPPPIFKPAVACRRALDQIVAATNNRLAVERINRLLSPLMPVPESNHTQRLDSLLCNLCDIQRKQHSLRSAQTAFASLAQPPEKIQTPRMRQLILNLEGRLDAVTELKTRVESLSALMPPAAEIDLMRLTTAIDQLSASLTTNDQTQKRLDLAKHQVSDCESKIRQFVKSNPNCETCGATLDPESLMTKVPMEHDHSPASDFVSNDSGADLGDHLNADEEKGIPS